MTAEHYHALRGWFEAHPLARRCVVTLDRWLPLIPFVCYPVLLCLLNVQLFRLFSGKAGGAPDFMMEIARSVFVPGLTFWGGTLLRDKLNWPRPYEQPSLVWMRFYPAVGWVMVGITALICLMRVLTGVHYPRDVLCGAALGFALGYAGMWLL